MSKNKYIFKKAFAVTIFLTASLNCNAQFFFRVGYNLALTSPREINRVIYIHNQINNTYYASGNDLNEIKNLGGIHIAMGSEFDKNQGWEMSWSNRHHVSKSEFQYQGQTVNRYLKVRTNNFSFGFYGGGDNISFGGSLDFGNCKGFYKRTDDTTKNAKYISVFQNKQPYPGVTTDDPDHNMLLTTQIGFTPFVQLKAGPLGVRLFYQFQFMNLGIDNLDNKLLGGDIEPDNQLQDRLSNFGLLLFLQLGGYK